jgi:hypothetical protein
MATSPRPPSDRAPRRRAGGATDVQTRFYLAAALLLIFLVTIVFSFIAVMKSRDTWLSAQDLLKVLLPVESGLVGGAMGYYFGSKT